MSPSRIVPSCCLTFLVLPLLCCAQSDFHKNDLAAPENAVSVVSARELSIPEKAIKAFNKGSQLLATKNSAASVPEFERAIKAFPGFYEAYYKLGLAELELQRKADARAAFGKSIELSDARFAPPYFGLGLALCNENLIAEAETSIRIGLGLDPTDATGNFTLAWVLYSASRLSDAEKSARQAILYSANFAMAYLLLGQIHLRQNNLPALVEDLDTYLRLAPDSPQSGAARIIRTQAQHFLARHNMGSVVARANP
jgi:tetratricopeptide (TPR) repeat protein